MKKLIASITMLALLLALLLAGCSLDDLADPTGQVNPAGPADASTPYVAIGNSLTAGFMDSGLMKAGQASSYPMIIATQMGLTKDNFTQPWIDFPGIGTTKAGPDSTSGILYYDGTTVKPVAQYPKGHAGGLLLAVGEPQQYNNLGVPGAFMVDIMNAHSAETSYGAVLSQILPDKFDPNSFFEFINRAGPLVNLFKNIEVPADPPKPGYQTGSQFYQVIARGPALVTVWIGGNDFLFGALSGDPVGAGNGLITDPVEFGETFTGFLHSLAGGLLKRNKFPPTIIASGLPEVKNISYFLPRDAFEAVFGARTYEEPDAEFILFANFLGSGLIGNPDAALPATLTLSTEERRYLNEDIIGAYNSIIQSVVQQVANNPEVPAKAAYVDFNGALNDLGTTDPEALLHFLYLRIIHDTDTIAETAARCISSLDGVHPNNRGYVLVANGFLAKIDELTGTNYGSIPLDAVVYDPTYGMPVPEKAVPGAIPRLSPEVIEAMRMSFR